MLKDLLTMNRNLKITFGINTFLTLMAFVLFIVSPRLLPDGVGVAVNSSEYFLGYMLGAAELGLATMTLLGIRLTNLQAVRVIAASVIVFHLASAGVLMQVYFAGQSSNPMGLWANVLIPRFGIAIACVYFAFYKNPLTGKGGLHEKK